MAEGRRSLEESWAVLKKRRLYAPRDSEGRPSVPDHLPTIQDSEPLGISFFRGGLAGADVSDLTVPRIFFGRSLIEGTLFRNTDMNQSCMCWCDWDDCDFSEADLTCCDMRSSIFRRCKFTGAVLVGADLRRSTFEGCDFTDADLTAAIVWKDTDSLEVSDEQCEQIDWRPDPGPEPAGG
jgi:uncharacterized protein YjbI with pentapeptide repeats